LADYINAQNIEDNSMLAVGHSMGHLNQSNENKYYTAAKKIYKLYTISTPHKGSNIAALVERDDGAVHNLSVEFMKTFNQEHPYTHHTINNKLIPILALRFTCNKSQKSDGVVAIDSQVLDGAPYSKEIYRGKHTSGLRLQCENNAIEELTQSRIIEGILDNTIAEIKTP